jgi:SAM-dependent methyltransferase
LHHFWRDYSDAVSGEWLKQRLPGGQCALKTDMFDEIWTAGLSPSLTALYGTVIGIDISGDVLHGAQWNAASTLLTQADVRRLPFATASFDCVLSPSTLDHFDSEDQIVVSISELHRVLRPGGDLLLTLDNPVNPFVRLRNALPFKLMNKIGLVPYPVGATCTPGRLQDVLKAAGFHVIEITATVHCPRVAVVLLAGCLSSRMKRRLLSAVMPLERCGSWATRYITGHFTAVHALKER